LVTACQSLDRLEVIFDDDLAVANAGLLVPATLAGRLGLEAAANELVGLSGPGYFLPGRKVMTLVPRPHPSPPGHPNQPLAHNPSPDGGSRLSHRSGSE
jgi:hypothetical protein